MTAKKTKEPGAMPATLIRELSAHRTAALQAAMALNPAMALAAAVATMALPLFYDSRAVSCLDISLRPTKAADMAAVAGDAKPTRSWHPRAGTGANACPATPPRCSTGAWRSRRTCYWGSWPIARPAASMP